MMHSLSPSPPASFGECMRNTSNPPTRSWFLLVVLLLCNSASASTPTAEQIATFEKEVRPLLIEKCIRCHGPKKQESGLRLDSRDALMRGGESGPAIVPGQPDKSLLLKAVRHQGDLQ